MERLYSLVGLARLHGDRLRAAPPTGRPSRGARFSGEWPSSSCSRSSCSRPRWARTCSPGSGPRSPGFSPCPTSARSSSSASWGPAGPDREGIGFIFAFRVLPTIVFVAATFAILYHLGIMQVVVQGAAWVMSRLMGASGAESLDVAASIFMGQTEAPAHHPALPEQDDAVRADVRHDRGHGPRERRDHGGLHRLRRGGQASPRRRDHDRAGHDPPGQALRARDRHSRDHGLAEGRPPQGPTPTSSGPPLAAPAKD